MIQMKFLILILIYLISIPGIAFPTNWEFVTSATTSQGIEIAYYIDTDEIKAYNGTRSYRERRIYKRKGFFDSIGALEVFGYYECVNNNFAEVKVSFLSPDEKYLDGYGLSGNENTWKPVTNNITKSKFDFVCSYNKR